MEDVAELVLVGGHPALDLVNTAERGTPRPSQPNGDALLAPADVVTWARRVGVVGADETVAEPSLLRTRQLREAVHVLCDAVVGAIGWDEASAALDLLTRAHRAALGRGRLVPDVATGRLTERLDAGPHVVVDRVALAAVDLLSGDLASRVRRCPIADGGCGWVFLDRTKNRSRTWCRMADCGTRVKSRRLTERRRQQRREERA